jgi:hypothetical protein
MDKSFLLLFSKKEALSFFEKKETKKLSPIRTECSRA